jgi:branched-subunit amino acid aminotransferase/4-amino-4-deoxychorismate lyase
MLIEIDGNRPDAGQLASVATDYYGHFTAMQVRDHRVRGLGFHLERLTRAHAELFGTSLDGDLVRRYVRHALQDGTGDGSVRVNVRQPAEQPVIMVTVREPGPMPGDGRAWRLASVPYQRTAAHIKRMSDFGQAYFQRSVQRDGFDEALLTGPDGLITEGSVTNVGFVSDGQFVWPQAPVLAGVTMQVLEAAFASSGIVARREPVRLADLDRYEGAFVTNARGIAPVSQIDDRTMPGPGAWLAELTSCYESVPWDPI